MSEDAAPSAPKMITMAEFLEWAKHDPLMTENAAMRAYRKLFGEDENCEIVRAGDDPKLMRALALTDPDELIPYYSSFADIEGRELELRKLAQFLFSAAGNDEPARQILVFVGGTGTAKSTVASRLYKILEGSPLWMLDGCPMHEHPFRILPRSKRREYSEQFGVPIHPDADICHVCRLRLHEEFKNDWTRFPVKRTKLSARQNGLGVGASVMFPTDPLNADSSLLIGRVNLAMLDSKEYPEGHPKTLLFTGHLHHAEQGLLEVREIFKVGRNVEILNTFIFATQEKETPGPSYYGRVSTDCVILGHSNLSEYRNFLSEPTNEALKSRMVVIEWPHLLRWSAEARAYEKELRRSVHATRHRAPHLLDVTAKYAVATRIDVKKQQIPALVALSVYDGDEGTKNVRDLRKESPNDGWVGLDFRFFLKAIGFAYAAEGMFLAKGETACVIWPDVKREILDGLNSQMFTSLEREDYEKLLANADDWYVHGEDGIRNELIEALIGAQEEYSEAFFSNYVDRARQWLSRKNTGTDRHEAEAAETFLKSVEQAMGIAPTQAEGMRREIVELVDEYHTRGETFNWQEHQMFTDAIKRHLVARFCDLVVIPTQHTRSMSAEAQEVFNDVSQHLQDAFGYCPVCAEKTLRYASENHEKVFQ